MANDKDNYSLVDPASIRTPEMLADFLAGAGFRSRPVPEEDNQVRILHHSKIPNPLQRYLIAQDNEGFQSHALVSIESGQLCVYYYEMENDLFRVWEVFDGIQEVEKVKKTISDAMTEEAILKRFYR